jgi:TRAP-type C4-dicarboxylate transport system substrate-binding protein
MKKVLITILFVMLFAGSAVAEPIVLKYAQFEPSNEAFAMKKIWLPWVKKMNELGEGMFKIEVYVGGALNRVPPKQLKILKDGVADIAFILPYYTPGIFADDAVLEIPFLANKSIDASLAAHNLLMKGKLRGYDDIVPLMLAAGQQYAVHTTFAVKTPSDLKGKKIRAAGQIQHFIAQSCGAAPIGMPVTKIAESMSRGVIQGTTNEWNGMRTFKIEDVARYHCMLPMGTPTFLLAMNKDSFNKLPKKAQDIFMDHREWTARLWANEMDKSLDEHHKKIEADSKHKVYYPTSAELEQWKQAIQPAVDQWLKEDAGRPQLLEDYKKELAAVK